MYSKTFGYNFFTGSSILFWLATLPVAAGVFLSIIFNYTWMVPTMVYYFLLLAAGYWVRNHRASLIIDETGITLYDLSGNVTDYIEWEEVGHVHTDVTRGFGKNKVKGIEIVKIETDTDASLSSDDDDDDFDDDDDDERTMFIQTSFGKIAACKADIVKAIESGIDCYVHHKRKRTFRFDNDSESLNSMRAGIGVLLVSFAIGCVFLAYQYGNLYPAFYEELIAHSLMDGSNTSGSFISTLVCYALPIIGLIMLYGFPSSLMIGQVKRALILAAVSLALLAIGYFLIIPKQQKLFQNCRDLNFQHPDTVTTVVSRLHTGKGGNYMSFRITYDGSDYEVKTRYVKDADEGMPMRVVVQKGSLDIPVVTMIEIKYSYFYWKYHILGDTYNEMAYFHADNGDLQQALNTIDIAIATDSTIANYYDSKGEFLLRNGYKDEAARMWEKVITLDPFFLLNHHSWLNKELTKLGISTTPPRKETKLIKRGQKINKAPTLHQESKAPVRPKKSKDSTIHWDNINRPDKWTEESLTINGKSLGRWTILESASVDPIDITLDYHLRNIAPKYGMLLAYQREPARVLILVGNRNNKQFGNYVSVNPPMDKEVKIWFDNKALFVHPKRSAGLNGVYELNQEESLQFIRNARKEAESVSFVSVRKGTHVVIVHNF